MKKKNIYVLDYERNNKWCDYTTGMARVSNLARNFSSSRSSLKEKEKVSEKCVHDDKITNNNKAEIGSSPIRISYLTDFSLDSMDSRSALRLAIVKLFSAIT